MPGKHAPASPRSFYLSFGRALGAALGAVALMVVAVLVLLNRGDNEPKALPIVSGSPTVSATSPSPSPSPTPSATPKPKVLAPNQVTVDVLNGTSQTGLARATGKKISDEGYRVLTVGNTSRTAKSTIFYRPGRRREALAFQQTFPEFTVVRESSATGDAMLRVVIGADYPAGT